MSQEKKGSIKKAHFRGFHLRAQIYRENGRSFYNCRCAGNILRTILTSFLRLYVEFREIVQGFGRK